MHLTLPGKSIFGGAKPNLPPEAPPIPTLDDPATRAKKEKTRVAAISRKGLLSTVTNDGGGQGTDDDNLDVTRKTLG